MYDKALVLDIAQNYFNLNAETVEVIIQDLRKKYE